jgi:hypothetical protein
VVAVSYGFRNARYVLLALLLWALPAAAQMEIGDTSTTMNGTVSLGYDGSFGQTGVSSHGLTTGFDGHLQGHYYNQNFVSFQINPYYNRSQNNSAYQSVFNASGVNANANLFSGSHFPGFFSYNKTYENSGSFGLPGTPGLTTHGSGQGFSVGWSALLPEKPTLSVSYTQGSGSSTAYGSSGKSESGNKIFDLHSDYTRWGTRMRGFFQHQNSDASSPSYLAGFTPIQSNSSSNTYGFTADHKIFWNGDLIGGWHRNTFTYEYVGGQTHGSTDTENLNAMFRPIPKMSLGMSVNHFSNLSGALMEQVIGAGGIPTQSLSQFSSGSTQYTANAGYTIGHGLYVQGNVTHWNQRLGSKDVSSTLYGGTLNYNLNRRFLGSFTLTVGVMDNATQAGHQGTTLITNVGYSRKIDGWDISGHFNYDQNLQTLVTVYTTSSYGYGASVRRKLGYRTYWNASFSGGHSGLSQFAGYSNESESYSTSFTHRSYGISATYAKSDGSSLFTPSGLVPVPVPAPVLGPDNLVLYNATGWAFAANGSPIRRLQLSASFSRSLGSTLSPVTDNHNYSNMLNMQARYPIRKLYFTAGYTKFRQGISATGTAPTDVTTYFLGLSRWFNFF